MSGAAGALHPTANGPRTEVALMRPTRCTAVALVIGLALAGCSGLDVSRPASPGDAAQSRSAVEGIDGVEVIATEQHPTDGGSFGDIAVRGDRAVASWDVDEGTRYAWRTLRGWSEPRLVPDVWQGPVAIGPHRTALVTWQGPRNSVSNGAGHLYARVRTAEGWSPTRRLGGSSNGPVKVEIHDSGAMTVAWSPDRTGISVVSRSTDGTWGEATHLRGGRYVDAIDLATDRDGNAAVAWVGGLGIRTATRGGDQGWTDGPSLDTGAFYPADVEITLDDAGRMIALWGASPEEDSARRKYLGWSVKPDRGVWSPVGYLDLRPRATVLGTDHLALDVNRTGDALAAWSTEEFRDYSSFVARFDVDDGAWTRPVDLGRPGVSEALLHDSGAALVGMGESWAEPRWFWWVQSPGEPWQRRRMDLTWRSTVALGVAEQEAAALIMSRTVAARFLDVP